MSGIEPAAPSCKEGPEPIQHPRAINLAWTGRIS
jgi:hypothetical protein